jgi:hypothetical protein
MLTTAAVLTGFLVVVALAAFALPLVLAVSGASPSTRRASPPSPRRCAVPRNLTRSEVRAVSRALRAVGFKLPRVGWEVSFRVSPGADRAAVAWPDRYVTAIARDARGYYFIRSATPLHPLES